MHHSAACQPKQTSSILSLIKFTVQHQAVGGAVGLLMMLVVMGSLVHKDGTYVFRMSRQCYRLQDRQSKLIREEVKASICLVSPKLTPSMLA